MSGEDIKWLLLLVFWVVGCSVLFRLVTGDGTDDYRRKK